jgi:hypothetical protein
MPTADLRRTFAAAALLHTHPPRLAHPNKRAVFELAFGPGETPRGSLEVTRWLAADEASLDLSHEPQQRVVEGYFDYPPLPSDGLIWHLNFADPRLFAAYGSPLFAQDEMQVAEHPLLGCVREALLAEGVQPMTRGPSGATPWLVRGVERRVTIDTAPSFWKGRPNGLYGNEFAQATVAAVRRATRPLRPAPLSNIVAIAAPVGHGRYQRGDLRYALTAAFTGLRAAYLETRRALGESATTTVHTGFWGCGAFGGNRELMLAIQLLAARAAGVEAVGWYLGDRSGAATLPRSRAVVADAVRALGTKVALEDLVAHLERLGYEWGVSDGN